MFNLLKKIFEKKNKKDIKKSLELKSISYDFNHWIESIKKNTIIDFDLLNKLKIFFIKFNIDLETSSYLLSQIEKSIKKDQVTDSSSFLILIKQTILDFYQKSDTCDKNIDFKSEKEESKLYLFVGVNGVGKTTTIGKLAFKFRKEKKKVLLVAGDIFRDGAVEQLKTWSEITKSVFFQENNIENKKTSKLFFNALKYAEFRNFDFILCDTSGRLQNNINLMKELEKIKKIIEKNSFIKNNYKIFLVIDSMTGNNALNQVELFKKILPIDSIILTKFDGISKAGIILSIKYIHNLKIKYIGIGEKNDDLIEFNIKDYVDYLLS